MKGVVKFFNTARGFGFIATKENEKDIYIHMDDMPKDIILDEGMEVEFDVEDTKKGLKAKNVKLCNSETD